MTPATALETTERARLWQVRCADGSPAVLKLFRDLQDGEGAFGVALMRAWNGHGAARVLRHTAGAVLTEWVEGPTLGALSRAGQDPDAAAHLVDVACALHVQRPAAPPEVPYLSDWFDALFALHPSNTCRADGRRAIARSRALARELLDSQHDIRPLHGDLHHDNVLLSASGPLALDAKGVLGERAYELANAFRNPWRAALVADRGRIGRLADLWSRRFAVDRGRLLKWAAAHCALSIAWDCGGKFEDSPDIDLLNLLLDAAES